MSFAADVKSELMREMPAQEHCARAELAALVALTGSVSIGLSQAGARRALVMSSESAAVARRIYSLLRRAIDAAPEIRMVRSARLGDRVRYQLTIEEAQARVLIERTSLRDAQAPLGIASMPDAETLRRRCCRRAYLRGAFLACGWIGAPEKGYQLEFAAPDEDKAASLRALIQRLGVPAKVSPRKNQCVAYVKEGESVGTLLNLMGANQAYLAFENARVLREVRNGVNRQLNCDGSNIEKTISASANQRADIEYIDLHLGLAKLAPPLRQIAEARLNHPDATLAELGQQLSPPIGKSGVNNRLRRLGVIAQSLREQAGEAGS